MEDNESGRFMRHACEQYKKYETYIENWKNKNHLSLWGTLFIQFTLHVSWGFFINDVNIHVQMMLFIHAGKSKTKFTALP